MTRGEITWSVSEQHGTVRLQLRHANGSTAELTLLPAEAMRLGDKCIEIADTAQRRNA